MHVRRHLSVFGCITALSLVLSGCGATAPSTETATAPAGGNTQAPTAATSTENSQAPTVASSSGEKVELTFSYLWTGPEAEALEKIIANFNSSQDNITVKGVSSPDFQKQLAQMSGQKGFDISDNFGGTVGAWASKGILEPLDDYIAKDNYDLTDFIPASLAEQKHDGKTYALPIAVHTTMLIYNEDLLKEAGLSGPPKTMEELQDAIVKLTKVDAQGNLTQLGMAYPSYIALAYAFGGDWVDAQGKPSPNNPQNIAAMNFYVDNIIKKYGVDQLKRFTSGFGEYASPQNPFYVGKVAMTMDGEWQARFIEQYAPNLKWGVTPLPHPADKPELAGSTQLTSSMFFIPANSQHKQEAWEFLKYLVSNDAMRDFSFALGNLPARTSLLGDAKYQEIKGFSPWLESLKSQNIKIFPNASWGAEYQNELNTAIDAVNNLKMTPEQAMTDVQQKMANKQ